jgi:hypothetical protein
VDELPPNARAALAQMKHAHDPDDPDAKARVQARVAAAVGLAAGAAGLGVTGKALASAGHKSLWARLAAHKLATTLSVAGVASVGAVTVPKLVSMTTTVGAPSRAPETGARRATPEVPAASAEARPTEPPPAEAAAPDSLGAELALLGEADIALQVGMPHEALNALRRHAARFPNAALREERLGLEAIARCGLRAPDAHDQAAAFARAFPSAVLLARVKLACAR